MDKNGYLLACNVWDRGTMPVLRGPDGGGNQFLQMFDICVFFLSSIGISVVPPNPFIVV